MKIYIEIFHFSGDQAHGAIVIAGKNLEPTITIPISMPIQSYETAIENNLLQDEAMIAGLAQSTVFFSPNEFKPS